jgi:hypothetical protein
MRRRSVALSGTSSVAREVIREPSFASARSTNAGAARVDEPDRLANRPSTAPTTPDDKKPASLPIEGGIVTGNTGRDD